MKKISMLMMCLTVLTMPLCAQVNKAVAELLTGKVSQRISRTTNKITAQVTRITNQATLSKRSATQFFNLTTQLPMINRQITALESTSFKGLSYPQHKKLDAPLIKNTLDISVKELRVLSHESLREEIANDEEMKLFVPETFEQAEDVLYRGLRLNSMDELKNILVNGMEISKTHHGMIYVSPNLSIAMGYMFPQPTDQLLGTAQDEMLPVLIKIPKTERLLRENPPQMVSENSGGRRIFSKDVTADALKEVVVYAEINGKEGWYRVTLENSQLIFTLVPTKMIRGWISK